MKCPHCTHEFKLTWKRYIKSLQGNHTCPDCLQVSVLKSISKLEVRIAYAVTITLIAIYTFSLKEYLKTQYSVSTVMIVIMLTALPIALPLDKWHDEKRKALVKE